MLTRVATVTALSAFALLAASAPAGAAGGWGYTDCSQQPNPGCELGAGKPGSGGQHGGPGGWQSSGSQSGGGHSHSGGNGGGSAGSSGGDTISGGDANMTNCAYRPSDYQPPSNAVPADFQLPSSAAAAAVPAVFHLAARTDLQQPAATTASSPGGGWYVYQCSGPGWHDALYRPPVWIPSGQQPTAAAQPSPADLAQQAHNQLHLPTPGIEANPRGEQLVTVPTWLWLDRNTFHPVTATASVPGVSVTAVASPTSVSWAMGDGDTVTCNGPGTPFGPGSDPRAASPDCGHTYRRSSAAQADQAFPVSVTVHWTVTWSGAGQGGAFPDMTTTANSQFRVAEAQALNTGG